MLASLFALCRSNNSAYFVQKSPGKLLCYHILGRPMTELMWCAISATLSVTYIPQLKCNDIRMVFYYSTALYASVVFVIIMLTIRLSVCPSHACIVRKRKHLVKKVQL